VSTVWLFCE
jgi:hypothetical protein